MSRATRSEMSVCTRSKMAPWMGQDATHAVNIICNAVARPWTSAGRRLTMRHDGTTATSGTGWGG